MGNILSNVSVWATPAVARLELPNCYALFYQQSSSTRGGQGFGRTNARRTIYAVLGDLRRFVKISQTNRRKRSGVVAGGGEAEKAASNSLYHFIPSKKSPNTLRQFRGLIPRTIKQKNFSFLIYTF